MIIASIIIVIIVIIIFMIVLVEPEKFVIVPMSWWDLSE